MAARSRYDAVVVGAGPNGLAAAITLAQAGRSVVVYEARETIGGGCRSAELTLPGFVHDVCSAIHPLGAASPFFRTLPLEQHGLEWVHSPAPLAHPFDDGTAAVLERSVEATAAALGEDGDAYRGLFNPLLRDWELITEIFLGPLRPTIQVLGLSGFVLRAVRSASGLAQSTFTTARARALLAGISAHAMLPLDQVPSASFGLMLALAGHAVGWPMPRGGSQRLADALASYLRSLGGEIRTGEEVRTLDHLPPARAILCDVTPRQLLRLAGDRLSAAYQRRLSRFRYGPGVFKLDLALAGPIPWRAAECARAATVHLGGTLDEMAVSERAVWRGQVAERPYVLLAQQSLFDDTRAPAGKHAVWAYCHVPSGSNLDMTERIEAQIERFAPGFRDRILARHSMTAVQMEQYNPNYIGGDIAGGVSDLWQLFTRPTIHPIPYATPDDKIFLCSSSTPPGAAVHGMCGYYAAQTVLRGGWNMLMHGAEGLATKRDIREKPMSAPPAADAPASGVRPG
jgi:phytoene dehydrogenase-like protein